MSDVDRARWDARHTVAGPGRPAPPDGLRGRENLLPAGGRALDVACGRGTVAVWLAERGFTVDAVDVSPVALAAGEAMATQRGVDGIRWFRHDLDAGLPTAVAGVDDTAGTYDLVVCQRFRDPTGYPALAAALAPGALLVVTVLSEVDEDPGPYRAAPGELLAAFGNLDVLAHVERDGEAALLARLSPTGLPAARR